jgi:hypothetical protein
VQSFAASGWWFEGFKGRHGYHCLKLTGEAVAKNLKQRSLLQKLYSERQKASCQLSVHRFVMRDESYQCSDFAKQPAQPHRPLQSPASSESSH